MASVLLMSDFGDGLPIAIKLAREGHIVKVYIRQKKAKRSLQGFKNPSQVQSPKMLDQYDLILFDMAGLGQQADSMVKQGRSVIGGGSFNDKLELDREYGEKVARSLLKINVPTYKKAGTVNACVKALETAGKPLVVKPLGNQDTRFTLVSDDKANRPLISLVKNLGADLFPVILQERIDGVEISTEGWFNGKKFKVFNHTLEHKRFMEGELGPMTGCMGNVVWLSERNRLIETALTPLGPLLKKVNFVGPIDVNCIVTEEEAYFLEFTPRFGYDAIQAWCELIKGSLFDFLWKLSIGDRLPDIRDDYAIAVRLSVPPYPMKGKEDLDILQGVQFLDIKKGAERHTYLSDVMMNGSSPVCAGVDGVLGCVTARGDQIQEVRRRAYRTARNIIIHGDVQYRKDIGAGVERKIEKLKTWGWL